MSVSLDGMCACVFGIAAYTDAVMIYTSIYSVSTLTLWWRNNIPIYTFNFLRFIVHESCKAYIYHKF